MPGSCETVGPFQCRYQDDTKKLSHHSIRLQLARKQSSLIHNNFINNKAIVKLKFVGVPSYYF